MSSTELEGQIIKYNYDTKKRLIHVDKYSSTSEFSRTTFNYDDNSYLTAVIDPNKRRTDFTYNGSYIEKVQEPSTNSKIDDDDRPGTTYKYNGRNSSVIDPLGNETRYVMDENYVPIIVIDSLGNENETEFDSNYNPHIFIDPKGNELIRTYDDLGNILDESDENDKITTYTYTPDYNHIKTEKDPKGNVTIYHYNKKGEVTEIIDAKNKVTTYTYDDYGNQTSIAYPDKRVEYFEYDRDGNNITITKDPNDNTTRIVTDNRGNEISKTDGEGNTISFEYDKQDKLKKLTDEAGTVTNFNYDDSGNLSTTLFTNNSKKIYEYNGSGQLVKLVDQLGHTYQYKYDDNGNKIETTTPKGNVLVNEYDANNNLKYVKLKDKIIFDYTYDVLGNLTSINNSEKFTYTDAGLLSTKTERGNSQIFSYFDNNVLESITYTAKNDTSKIQFEVDELDQVTKVKHDGRDIISYKYDDSGELETSTRGNGTYSKVDYDNAKNIKVYRNYDISGNTINEFHYTYNKNNQVKTIKSSAGTVIYEYDERNQLVEEKLVDDTIIKYEYDNLGNRLNKKIIKNGITETVKSEFNDGNQIVNQNSKNWVYDKNGNLLNDGKFEYVYNEFDHLIEAININNREVIFKAEYDEEGKRTRTQIGEIVRNYYYDGDSVLYETDGNGNKTIEYIWENGSRDPIAFIYQGNIYYYHINAHGDIVSVTNSSGKEVAGYAYDSWGNILEKSGEMADINPYRFAGYRYDDVIEKYYLKSRYYAPSDGIFLSTDPNPGTSDSPLSQNGYNYTLNNPVEYVDHNGEHPVIVIVVVSYRIYKGVKVARKTYKVVKVAKSASLTAKKKKVHGNSHKTTKKTYGYKIVNKDNIVMKYGETTRGTKRYTQKWYRENNYRMVIMATGTKKQMHQWQHEKILQYKKNNNGERPKLNKSDW